MSALVQLVLGDAPVDAGTLNAVERRVVLNAIQLPADRTLLAQARRRAEACADFEQEVLHVFCEMFEELRGYPFVAADAPYQRQVATRRQSQGARQRANRRQQDRP